MLRRRDEAWTAAIRALRATAREVFEAGDDDAVLVSELQCTEPGCPPVETVVALLREGEKPRQVKVHKPAVEVTGDDLRAAMRGGDGHNHH
jgi:hypothetical protein